MTFADPSVSVIIPAYNAQRFIAQTLQSVRNQTVAPLEIIVVDDGSLDATPQIARAAGATVVARANGGPSAARNAGGAVAAGDYLAFLDADDLWHPRKLAIQLEALARLGRPAFSFTDYRPFDERGTIGGASVLRRTAAFRRLAGAALGRAEIVIPNDGDAPIMYDSYLPPSVFMVRRDDFAAVGGFCEQLWAGEDFEFLLRMFRRVPAVAVMQPLTLYRQHATQLTSTNATAMRTAFFEVARLVAAEPDRYRAGDAAYLARTTHLRHYRVGFHHARAGQFPAARTAFEQSLAVRWSPAAQLGLIAARIAGSAAGRTVVEALRTLWRRRPGKR